MGIESVEAVLDGKRKVLEKEPENKYRGEMQTPKTAGEYTSEINAYDTAGNVSVSKTTVFVTKWHTPKTDWKRTDRFNIKDYNRIKGNLEFLWEKACILHIPFAIIDMKEDKEDYASYFYADELNLFEKNLEIINQHIFTQNYGYTVLFFDNGPFINFTELNRIERAILSMNEIMERMVKGMTRLSFPLGNLKGVKT